MRISTCLLALCLLLFLSASAHAQFGDPITIDLEHFGSAEICTGDLNSDGLPDVIVASAYSVQSIDGYINLGNGEFGERQILLSDYLTMHFQVACADLDSDADDDLLIFVKDTLNFNSMTMSWLRNDGGIFSSPILLDEVIEAQVELLTVDLNNDGHIDIIMDDDATVRAYLNDGEGNFSSPEVLATNSEHYAVEANDFNGDGFKDLVVSSNVVTVHFNNQVGGFIESAIIETLPSVDPFFITSGDYDNDGTIDFATWSAFFRIHVMLNQGDGTIFTTELIADDAFNCHSMHSADLDNDGDLDLLTDYDQSSAVVWFENDGSGQFSEEQFIYQQEEYNGLQAVTFDDLDQDGDVEVIWGAVNHGIYYHDNLSIVSSVGEFDFGSTSYFNVFPNPASANMTIELTTAGQSISQPSMLIFNMNGQWMIEEVSLNHNLASYDLSHLSAGHYLIELRSEGDVVERVQVVLQ